jgi:hypothetical protein
MVSLFKIYFILFFIYFILIDDDDDIGDALEDDDG